MKAGQVITLLCALLLLLPGTCFGVVGVMVLTTPSDMGWGLASLAVAALLFWAVWWLIRVVIRWNRVPPAA